ncbi:helix-turn-helix domain-containing protein [Riemerella anatipestifer]|nr:helix-turn-helix domain-containing protein [Riemerella anatipestifer]MDY3532360.1 helix-turn-helix domain-containing protein [Riemerella anatipestifer]MDY3535085.1 helix-turn-helix domain-containing protein [Riemerella anatipestifer]
MSSNIRVNRLCKHCGKTFIAKTFKTQFCSHSCNSRDYKLREKAKKLEESKNEYQSDLKISRLKATTNNFDLEELKAKTYLNIKETCILIGMSDSTIRKFIKEGKLKTIRLGKKHLVLKSQIDNLMN